VFVPYRESDGCFAIFSEEKWAKSKSKYISNTVNKVRGITDIAEAVRLVRAGGHRWRFKDYLSNQPNIFRRKDIVIHEL
jgi:hypothetical protein